MNTDYLNDPELTAFALGELDGASHDAWEERYQSDPDVRRAVDELRTLAGALTQELAAEAQPGVMPITREALQIDVSPRRVNTRRRLLQFAIAASLIGVVSGTAFLLTSDGQRNTAVASKTFGDTGTGLPNTRGSVHGTAQIANADGSSEEARLPANDSGPGNKNPPANPKSGELLITETRAFHDKQSLATDRELVNPTPKPRLTPRSNESSPAAPSGGGTLVDALRGKIVSGSVPSTSAIPVPPPMPTPTAPSSSPTPIPASVVHNPTPQSAPHLGWTEYSKRTAAGDGVQNFSYYTGNNRGEGRPIAPEPGQDQSGGGKPDHNTEAYARIHDNPFLPVTQNPLSTFSIDVDTASYANVRRFLTQNQLPPADAVRIEELLNYFSYDYAPPTDDRPFAAHLEVAGCPWNGEHRLVRIGLKGKVIKSEERPPVTLTFLIDVSGSMQPANKLPLLKSALKMLVNKLTENDRVAMVVYAGASGTVLPSTYGFEKEKILGALDRLHAGGSTNGASGIQLAYQTAAENFAKGGVNRVILCTDGDFNVGVTKEGDLTRLIEEKARGGVFLSVLGFGMGNLKDSMLEKLADRGNGNYAYIDTEREARKVLVEQLEGTLITIAKDVKIQVEFNPAQVGQYRLIGYENRILAAEDFNDDKKDAGEIGAGHTVTALYEVVPPNRTVVNPPQPATAVDPLRYQKPQVPSDQANNGELLTLKLRYKQPDGDTSKLVEFPTRDNGQGFTAASRDFRFAAAVAAFGMQLRQSPHKGSMTLNQLSEIAEGAMGDDPHGYRAEFLDLIRKAQALSK